MIREIILDHEKTLIRDSSFEIRIERVGFYGSKILYLILARRYIQIPASFARNMGSYYAFMCRSWSFIGGTTILGKWIEEDGGDIVKVIPDYYQRIPCIRREFEKQIHG